MLTMIRPALTLFLLLTALTGIAYPLIVTGLAQAVFPAQAGGSLISAGDQVLGSRLIGQSFGQTGYFWSRPSATSPMPNNASASGGSNLGARNPALLDAVKSRVELIRSQHPEQQVPIPADLVTTSASGLDPHLSPAAAQYQAPRITRERGIELERVLELIRRNTEAPSWGLFGDARVNVLMLNLELDKIRARP